MHPYSYPPNNIMLTWGCQLCMWGVGLKCTKINTGSDLKFIDDGQGGQGSFIEKHLEGFSERSR